MLIGRRGTYAHFMPLGVTEMPRKVFANSVNVSSTEQFELLNAFAVQRNH